MRPKMQWSLCPAAARKWAAFSILCAGLALWVGAAQPSWAQTATATTLTITSGGKAVTTVPSGTVVTLTATVMAGTTPVTVGQVNFCDATAKYCEDIHIVGTAPIISAGKASIRFIPGIGIHSYKAIFEGTKSAGLSASAASPLTVTGLYPTATTIAQSGVVGHYTLTATVGGVGPVPPTGTVSFLDTGKSNAVLGTAALGAGMASLSFLNVTNPPQGNSPVSVVAADFNHDGILDLALANFYGNNVTVLLGDGTGNFTPTTASPSTGNNPIDLVTGDFNNDGIPDLAVANYQDGTITILLGKGDGTFTAAAASPAVGSNPDAITVGDFNGDGNLDLAVANYGSNSVTILLGDGHGNFKAVVTSPATGNQPSSIATGDLNGDGIPDLAVTNFNKGGAGTVTVLLGNGDGTFTAAPVSPATGTEPNSVVVGDFNGDGIADLAVANFTGETVTILLGNGNGTFTLQSSPATGNGPYSVAMGDFNGDGIPDLATTNYYDDTVTVLLGDGKGNFSAFPAAAIPPTGVNPISAAVGDFSGDGLQDLAIANYNDVTMTVLVPQNMETVTATASGIAPLGTGTHQVDASYPGDATWASSVSASTALTGQAPTTTTLALTAAGKPVTTVSRGTAVKLTATVQIGGAPVTAGQVNFCDATAAHCTDIHLLGTAQLTSAGTASIKLVPGVGSHSYKAVFAGIWGGQTGYSALSSSSAASLTVTGAYATTTTIAQSGNPGDYTLTATVAGAGSTPPTGTVSFFDTSDNDVVVGTAPLATGGAGLTFVNISNPAAGFFPQSIAVGDFNGDGSLDLAETNPYNNTNNTISVLLGDGHGNFTPTAATPAISDAWNVVTGDFNGDGILDLAVTSRDGAVTVFLGDGKGNFTPKETIPLTTADPGIAAGDFNGDGVLDLAVTDYGTCTPGVGCSNGAVTVLLGNGDGTFRVSSTTYTTGATPLSIAVGDFNGDGILDMAVPNACGDTSCRFGTVTILLGNGDGTFTAATGGGTGMAPSSIAVADFNGDGILDLAVANDYYSGTSAYPSTVTVLLGAGDGTFRAAPSLEVNPWPGSIAVGDFNGDGIPDLVAGSSYGTVTTLLGNGDGTFTRAGAMPQLTGGANCVAVGDLNGDGIADLAVGVVAGTTAVLLSQNQSATATVTGISPAGAGTHLIDASYSGDNNYDSSTSGTTGLTAELLPPQMTLTASSNSVKAGKPVTFTATVIAKSSPPRGARPRGPRPMATSPTPTGTATFYFGKTSLGSTKLNGKGQAVFATSSLPAGKDSVTASYSGDTNYEPATSSGVIVTVIPKIAPTVRLAESAGTVAYGASIALTATLTGSGAMPTGTVEFFDGTTQFGTANLNSGGVASYTAKVTVGHHSITAVYLGDSNYAAATSTAVSVTVAPARLTFAAFNHTIDYGAAQPAFGYSISGYVNGDTAATAFKGAPTATTTTAKGSPPGTYPIAVGPGTLSSANYTFHFIAGTLAIIKATPTVTLNSSVSTAKQGTTITFTATLVGTGVKPTGTVTFLDGSTKLGTGTLNSAGVGTYATSKLAVGKHSITAAYAGDGDYTAKTSTAVTVTITAP